jgi:restriction system protein
MGFERILSNTLGDSGSDLIALDPNYVTGGKVLVQAKRYSRPVPVEAVRSLYGAVLDTGAMKGILITTSGFGPNSYRFIKDKPLELIDGPALVHLLSEHAGIEVNSIPKMERETPEDNS